MSLSSPLHQLVDVFPHEGLSAAFAYGSGIFKQTGYSNDSNPLVDLIFVTDNAQKWHELNLEKFPSHYSFLKHANHNGVCKVQSFGNARVYFNTNVSVTLSPTHSIDVKYGVISTSDLLDDLIHWNSLYISGRLHKPVKFLKLDNPELRTALHSNLENALRMSLLLLESGEFPDTELYRIITSLSYAGDVRMKFAENPMKVHNIVDGNTIAFRELYGSFFGPTAPSEFQDVITLLPDSFIRSSMSPSSRVGMLEKLPSGVLNQLRAGRTNLNNITSSDLREAMRVIVQRSSRDQTIKGLFTAGPKKALFYGMRKIGKYVF